MKTDANGNIDLADLRAKAEEHSANARRADGDVSVARTACSRRRSGDLRDRARARRPGLHGRREHERAGRPRAARRHRRRRLPPQPAQDVLHPARRRRPGHGTDRRGGAPRAVPARPPGRARRAATHADRRGVGGAVGQREHPADLVDVHRHDGRRRTDDATKVAILNANYIAQAARGALSRCSTRARTAASRTSASSTRARFKATRRRRGRGHREAADGLRLPRADGLVPGGRHADDRADGERVEGGARPVLRRDDRDPRGDARDRDGGRWTARTTRSRTRRTRCDAVVSDTWTHALLARAGGVPGAVDARAQVLAGGRRAWRAPTATGNLVCSCPPTDAYAEDDAAVRSAAA